MGFFSSKKTFTSLSIIDMNTKDYADHVGFLSSYLNAPNGGAAIDAYMQFKKIYINKSAERFAIKNHMAAKNAGSVSAIDYSKLLNYVKTHHDSRASSIVYSNIYHDTTRENVYIYMENKYSNKWSTKTGRLTLDSGDPDNPDIYGKLQYKTKKINNDKYEINIHLETKDGSKVINDSFMCSNIYNEQLVIYYSINDVNDYFIFIIDKKNVPSELINIEPVHSMSIVPIKENGKLYTDKKLQSRYLRLKNIKGDDLIDSLDDLDDDGEPMVDNAYFTYAIPIDNQYTAVKPGTYDANQASKFSPLILKRAKKINGDGDSKKYVIDQKLVDWWLHKKRKNVWRYDRIIFDTLKYYKEILDKAGWKSSPTTAPTYKYSTTMPLTNITFKSGNTLFGYYIDIEIEVVDGILDESAKDGYIEIGYTKRSRVFNRIAFNTAKTAHSFCNPEYDSCGPSPKESDYYDLVLECQVSDDKYERLRLRCDFKFIVGISGYIFIYDLNGYIGQNAESGDIKDGEGVADPKNVRLMIPEHIGLHSRYKDELIINEYGFCLIAFSIKEVEVSWLSSILGIFVSFIIGLFTWGAGMAFTDFLIQFVVNTTISFLVNMVMQALDIPFLNLAVAFLGAFSGVVEGSMTFADALSSNFLPLATQVAKTVQQIGAVDAQKAKEEQERIEGLEKSQEGIDKMMSETDGPVILPYNPIAEVSLMQSTSPDTFIQSSLGSALYNYDIYFSIWDTMERKMQVQLA